MYRSPKILLLLAIYCHRFQDGNWISLKVCHKIIIAAEKEMDAEVSLLTLEESPGTTGQGAG
jgi:hypothetical protein